MSQGLGVALLGSKFMGRAHSNAWSQAPRFFDLPAHPTLEVVAARDTEYLAGFGPRFGWRRWTARWEEAVADPAVRLVDVATPNHLHRDQAMAALQAGKHVACEKPLAGTLADALEMASAAAGSDARTFVWFNYRRVPALAYAHRLVRDGLVGPVRHVRAVYLQSWGGPETPLLWRFRGEEAGSGAHGDLNAHIIDLARFLTGEEFVEVAGAIEARFVAERPLPEDPSRRAPSTVDDAVLFLGRFAGGAVASFEATRLATGYKNSHRIEIHGEHGAIRFDFERMNELGVFDARLAPAERGWRSVLVTDPEHPYASAWWPDGHWLGYEHTFVNQAADIVGALSGVEPPVPLPDFADAYETQRVMEAAILSARERCPIALTEVR
ncbi:MAG: Gfo/Idh/MocA family oxidoreductase [Acidimicrobiia bacterium]|jgi:predicted dehydrogenase